MHNYQNANTADTAKSAAAIRLACQGAKATSKSARTTKSTAATVHQSLQHGPTATAMLTSSAGTTKSSAFVHQSLQHGQTKTAGHQLETASYLPRILPPSSIRLYNMGQQLHPRRRLLETASCLPRSLPPLSASTKLMINTGHVDVGWDRLHLWCSDLIQGRQIIKKSYN